MPGPPLASEGEAVPVLVHGCQKVNQSLPGECLAVQPYHAADHLPVRCGPLALREDTRKRGTALAAQSVEFGPGYDLCPNGARSQSGSYEQPEYYYAADDCPWHMHIPLDVMTCLGSVYAIRVTVPPRGSSPAETPVARVYVAVSMAGFAKLNLAC
jgi:hypothetical protein